MPHQASSTGLSPAMARLSRLFFSLFAYNVAVLQPRMGIATHTVWALPRSLATTGGIIDLFSFPLGTKMFQFPRLASKPMFGYLPFRQMGCPIRTSMDQGLLAAPHGFSQLVASFIASVSLGIHHAPLHDFF